MTDHPVDALSAYIDDELDGAERAGVAAHLAACASCTAIAEQLTALRDRAAALATVEDVPSPALWTGIAARLEPRLDAVQATAAVVPWYRRRFSIGVPELALAATLFAGISAALLWRQAPAQAPAVGPAPVVAEAEPTESPRDMVSMASFADAQFDAAVQDLERVLREQRDRLNPRTVMVLERNLGVIDQAITEAREALAADPANALLNAHLAEARRRKLDLLRRAAEITGGD